VVKLEMPSRWMLSWMAS